MLIEFSNVSRKFGKADALKDINLQIKPGEILGVLGPNGSGKTTMINLLLGFLKPTTGTVQIDGIEVWENKSVILGRAGALIEIPRLYPQLTGYENLKLFCRLLGLPDTKAEEMLELTGLKDASAKAFQNYSLGMKQRLGIALSLLNDPNILIYDEPTNGLDPEGIIQVRELLKNLTNIGKTLILCSHLLTEVELICNTVVILQKGKILAHENVKNLYNKNDRYRLVSENGTEAVSFLQSLGLQISGKQNDEVDFILKDNLKPAELLKKLVEKGIAVTEFYKKGSGLEEFFLQSVQGDSKNV